MRTTISLPKLTVALAAVTLLSRPAVTNAESGYVAHEWGTFTSVQGRDGVQLDWQTLQPSELPEFVYDWKEAGAATVVNDSARLMKRVLIVKQRMETPVIYFYTDQQRTVDVGVRFPRGTITEWYPRAEVGAFTRTNRSGASVSIVPENRILWSGVNILPVSGQGELGQVIPFDKSGSHYYAARETDSAVISMMSRQRSKPEVEKFLFYRGAGNFSTPLQVGLDSTGAVTATNRGGETLSGLFVLKVHDGKGSLSMLDKLLPDAGRAVMPERENVFPIKELGDQLAGKMAAALVNQGLYPREAAAMVNTWRESWFAEDGIRVLYLLPRTWTDDTLPLTLAPSPRELVRVMVGRAEVISPSVEQRLRQQMTRAGQGEVLARTQLSEELKKLGRFADPALRLASRGLDARANEAGWKIFALNQQNAGPKPAADFVAE
jgi:hypothetical protein